MSGELVIAIVVICLLAQAFFAGSEIALVSCDKVRMRRLAEEGSKRAKHVLDSFLEAERFISTTLVGINVSLITGTIVVTLYMMERYETAGELYAILIMSPLIIIFGQVVPKGVFQKRGDTLVLWSIYPLWLASRIFSPITSIVSLFTKGLLRVIGSTENPFITREELIHVIEGEEATKRGGYRQKIIQKIFRFSETTVYEIMIPLIQVSAVRENAPVSEAVKMIKETGYSRIPVYQNRVDNIVGLLYAFDLLGADPSGAVKEHLHPAFYVPETKPVDKLLEEMKEGRAGMAIVVDEYGGAVGAITLEDILEEVVGEIEDEYDKGLKLYRKIGDKEYLVNARIEIDQLNEEIGLGIPEGDYETLSGFILYMLGAIPKVGDEVSYDHIRFLITKASPRSVEEVKLILGEKKTGHKV